LVLTVPSKKELNLPVPLAFELQCRDTLISQPQDDGWISTSAA
jgi:hypothetical protein